MKVDIVIPEMGESVFEGNIAQILTPSGSFVLEGDEVLEIETDKVNQVLYAPANGTVSYTVSVGGTVQIGETVGAIDTEGKGEAAPSKKESKKFPVGGGSREFVNEYLGSLDKKQEVVKESKPKEGQRKEPMSRLRKTIAKRLVEVKNQTAMLTTFNEVDMSAVMQIRATEQEAFTKKNGVKLGFMSFFVKACVHALKEFSNVNAFIEGDDIISNENHNIGLAVSTDRGLLVPVLRTCDLLSFCDIEKELANHATAARDGTIAIDALQGGTFTITNGGVFGSLLSTPILNPPQSAILGMHTIQKRPVAINDEVVIRPMMYLALSYDHRIIDGKEAVSFLVSVKNVLEDPAKLLLEGCL